MKKFLPLILGFGLLLGSAALAFDDEHKADPHKTEKKAENHDKKDGHDDKADGHKKDEKKKTEDHKKDHPSP